MKFEPLVSSMYIYNIEAEEPKEVESYTHVSCDDYTPTRLADSRTLDYLHILTSSTSRMFAGASSF